MSYLKFDKSSLVNLEYSLTREFIRSNKTGSYLSTTISGCNTRKYHGLLICPVPQLGGGKHVLLSSLDETIIQHDAEFNLGIHKYEGEHYEPKGHKYIRDFDLEMVAKTTYRVGGVVLDKEILLVENDEQVLVRYTLREAHSPTVLRLKPFLAFRNIHQLSKANLYAYTKYVPVTGGIRMRLYEGYPWLHMQFSKEAEFIPVPGWYNNIEYFKEKNRGYEFREDLFVPGYFELPIRTGESVLFSASTREVKPGGLKARFTREYNGRIPRNSFVNSLTNSARQFIMGSRDQMDIIAGYPWYGGISRQTLVALPGLTLALDDPETFVKVFDTQIRRLKDGLLPKTTGSGASAFDSVDAPLWLFWALQQYVAETGHKKQIWLQYRKSLKQVLQAYRSGTAYHIRMNSDGLIAGGDDYTALTWMDSYLDGKPVVKRTGMPVEVNALWFNALCFALELAGSANDLDFVHEWEGWTEKIASSFIREFWSCERGYLADCVRGNEKDWTVRPNMVIAAAMNYSPLDREMQKSILSVTKKQLLTPRGLRTLTPDSPVYEGLCEGTAFQRERAAHQGTVWPWLIQFFVEAYLRVHKTGGMPFVQKIIHDFEDDMSEHCLGTIAEMYNGNPPHNARGAVSQAWSVGAVIRAYKLMHTFEGFD